MENQFPRTKVADMTLSRMIIGTNWLLGWSHTGKAADKRIVNQYQKKEDFFPVLKAFLDHGVDTIMGPLSQNPIIVDAIEYAREHTGHRMILIDTPILNVSPNPQARKEAQDAIRASAKIGASFCLIHHSSAEQLVNKEKRTLERLDDYTAMIREAGMHPGLSAHMPELITYSDANGYDVETYIQIYNCMGFLMQVEVETVANIIHHAKRPVMTIKPMAAGRCTPYVGLTFAWHTIRDRDLVAVGCFTPDEVYEDIEISLAALEHRFPDLERRSSPNEDQAAFGSKDW